MEPILTAVQFILGVLAVLAIIAALTTDGDRELRFGIVAIVLGLFAFIDPLFLVVFERAVTTIQRILSIFMA